MRVVLDFPALARFFRAAVALPCLAAAMLLGALSAAQAQPFNPDPTEKWKSPGWMPGGKAAIVTPELQGGRVYKLTPAQIIYFSAKENGINPLLLLVKIQAEQSLIELNHDAATVEHKLNRVVGYGIPEQDMFQEKWPGFYPQLVGMSYEFSTMAKKKDFHSAFLEYTPHEDKYAELVKLYRSYATALNRVSAKSYPTLPQSSGYLSDFRDISADHIQAFLDNYAGPLKNKQLFAGSASAPVSPAPISLVPNFDVAAYKAPTNSLVQHGYGGQCTAFAWGRTLEVTGKRMDSTRNAKLWWEDTKYPKGTVAKPFSIAVWSSPTYGHVAFVEQVKANGNIVINEANWNTFKKTNPVYGGGYDGAPKELTPSAIRTRGDATLLGYIYIADSSEMPAQDPNVVAQPVSREKFIGGLLKAFPSLPSNNWTSIEQSARSLGLIVGSLDGNTNTVRGDAAKIVFRLIQATDKAIPGNPDPGHYANDSELDADPEARTAAAALFAAGIASGQFHQARDMGYEFHPRRQLSVTEADLIQSRTLQFLLGSKLRSASAVTITKAQISGPATVGQVASFELIGTNLSAASPPRVSLAGCDTMALKVNSATSAAFTCTPRVAGPTRLFWKLPGNDTKEFELGQFTVLATSADSMLYVSDTPADNQLYDGGATFSKTWQLKNTGTTTWSSAWCLRPQDGPALGTAVCVIGTVPPGSAYSFSVPMTMPAGQASQVSLRQNWRLENAARVQVGQQIYASVQVKAKPAGLRVLEPFSLPDTVRVNTEWWVGSLKLSGAASQVRMQLTGPNGALTPFSWTAASADQWSLQYRFATPGDFSWTVSVQGATGTDSRSGSVRVLPPVALNPQLTRSASVPALLPWSATLRTDAPVYQADLVFRSGRRIPFDGGPTQWATRDENSRFTDAGNYDYELQLRRTAASALELFPGGTLEVRAAVVPANPPRITSAASVEQGQPYNLTVQTTASADKVMVVWPDQASEQGLQPLDAARTQWAFGNRLFTTAGALAYNVRSYKDGFTQPTGELQANLQVTVPNASMRLLDISRNIVKGEQPYFTVEASLAVTRVTVKLGALPAVPLVGSGPSGAVQNFRARVPVAEAGTVPYAITGYNARGQAVGVALTGTVLVADVGDTLIVPNPVPAELPRGQAVAWMFRTAQAPAEMWAEFSAPIGNLPLTGYYLNQTFNFPAGTYPYRVMRRDHLGNVFAIQGAAGSLRIKDAVQVAVPTAQVQVNPNPGQIGQAVQFAVQLSSGQDVARLEWVFPSTGSLQVVRAVPMQQTGLTTWALAQAFTSIGSRSSQLKVTMSDGRSAVLGSVVVTTADAAPAYTARVQPASVRVGQTMSFAVQVADPASVARAELVFTDVNVTEALVQTAANTWARTRPMAQAGANRPFVLRLLLKSGATAQVGGTYTVTP